jgi:exo-beta-1,3-glucanase (GH17 family)/cellulose synthase/poly-beta-1,6-N-acetylglucosamine synthase-like glycosyltransferase
MRIIIVAAMAAAAVHAAGWFISAKSTAPSEINAPVEYMSYSPYVGTHYPKDRRITVPAEQIDRDMSIVAGATRGVRSYSIIDGMDQLPAIAAKHGLNVSLGAWVGDTDARDKTEIETVVALAKQHRNVKSVLVGNEVLLRTERTVDQMVQMIRDVKKQVRVPVSTGEIWYLWLENPKLVKAVDYMAVHILPYWEGVSAEQAVSYTFDRIDELKRAYPGKRIVVAEFGWPSQGYNNLDAVPGALSQAQIIRDFVAEANRRGIEYNIVEAFDQPWKSNEGSVGAYWGMFTADRQAKFPMTGIVEDNSVYWKGGLALLIGFVLTVGGLVRHRPTIGHAFAYAAAANAMAAGVALVFAYPFENYMNIGIWMMWGIGFALVVPLTLMTLAKVHEIAEVTLGRKPRRLIDAMGLKPLPPAPPKVSIHIPAYREPADMVIETLNSLARLEYPNFEAIVIINNTPEAHYSAPVAAHCAALGSRFKFLDITCSGFKAGALNVALEHTAADAEIIAVIDADYVVEPDWLQDLVPFFDDQNVALIQAPQDHRDGDRSLLKTMMNSEYAGFFDIGMVQRNEDNAIIQHGTMCLVRRQALHEVGNWGTDTIVEDTELGLRLFEAGYQALYTNTRYGKGLLPDTFNAFKTQRFRWAYGAMQIIRKHWTHMLPGTRTLKPEQKLHFVTGWTFWLSDALGALASILSLLWVPMVLFVGVVIPTVAFTLPIITAFVVNLLHCALLYAKRVGIPLRQVPGAALAAMSLQLTVARAVATGLIRDHLPFKRTEKGGNSKKSSESPVFWETLIGILLAIAAAALILTNEDKVTEIMVYGVTLAIQSLPFLAAVVMLGIERLENRSNLRSKAAGPVAATPGAPAVLSAEAAKTS